MERISILPERNGKFIEILENDKTPSLAYGGNQDWYSTANLVDRKTSARMTNTGCGSVAAAGIIYHIAQNTQYGKGMLKKPVPTKTDFCRLASHMYFIHTPQTLSLQFTPSTGLCLGVWYVETIVRGIVNYASSKGVAMRGYSCNTRNTRFEAAANFICQALRANSPVIMLVYFNTYIRGLGLKYMSEMHFVTITGITPVLEEGEVRDYSLTISNHGMRQEIPSLRRLWNASGLYIMPKVSLGFAAKRK